MVAAIGRAREDMGSSVKKAPSSRAPGWKALEIAYRWEWCFLWALSEPSPPFSPVVLLGVQGSGTAHFPGTEVKARAAEEEQERGTIKQGLEVTALFIRPLALSFLHTQIIFIFTFFLKMFSIQKLF